MDIIAAMNDTKLYLYGAAGHAKVIAEMAEESGWAIAGAFDKNLLRETLLDQYPVHMGLAGLSFEEDHRFVVAIENNEYRKRIAEQELQGHEFATIQAQTAVVSKYAEVEQGTVIMPGAAILADVQLGEHCIVGANASIGHDCVIEDYVHIAANASLSGEVLVGEGTHIGAGASVLSGINIGKWCSIEDGTLVKVDIPDGEIVHS